MDYAALANQYMKRYEINHQNLNDAKTALQDMAQKNYWNEMEENNKNYWAATEQANKGYWQNLEDTRAGYQQLLQQASDAYNSAKQQTSDAYDDTANRLAQQLTMLNQYAQQQYDQSAATAKKQADQALAQAYANRVSNERNLAQQLDALGINGGGGVNAAIKLNNAYGQSRSDINTQLQDTIGQLLNDLNNQKSENQLSWLNQESQNAQNKLNALLQLAKDYESQKANYLANQLSDLMGLGQNYQDTLQKLLAEKNQSAFTSLQNKNTNWLSAEEDFRNKLYNQMAALQSALQKYDEEAQALAAKAASAKR